MGATNFDGPINTYGDMGTLRSSTGASLLSDPNSDAGPNLTFQGYGLPDTRYPFLKDLVQGYTGRVFGNLVDADVTSINTIPALFATNKLVTTAHTVAATPLTLTTTGVYGITINMPFRSFQDGIMTAPVALDWGFVYGTTTTGATSKTVTVLDSTQFMPGMPIIIAQAAGTNLHLFTWVTAVPTATTITINDSALVAGSFPIGTGDVWSPSEFGQLTPTSHIPALAGGPGLFLDPRQACARGIVTTVSGGTSSSNHIVIAGYDVYGHSMTESIPCTAATNWGKKAFKYVFSATPDFTDGTNNYTVGTSDVFGIHMQSDFVEQTSVWWNGVISAGANTGWAAADLTDPATTSTGDVRGTIQTSAQGGGTGIGANNSSGSVSTITISGRRLLICSSMTAWQQTSSDAASPKYMFGVTQV